MGDNEERRRRKKKVCKQRTKFTTVPLQEHQNEILKGTHLCEKIT